jgi:hypothetical protein
MDGARCRENPFFGISVALSSLGSVAAYALNDRVGLRLPIAGAILLMTAMLLGMILGSRSAALFVFYISLLQIGWIFSNCYLYSALIDANNLLVPAATPSSASARSWARAAWDMCSTTAA